MRKKVIALSLVLFLGFLTGSSSETPLVLCLGENGHIGIEMADHGNNGHVPVPVPVHSMNSEDYPCHDFDTHSQQEKCGNCYDFLLGSNSFTVNPKKNKISTYSSTMPVVPDLKYLLPFKLSYSRAIDTTVGHLHIKTTILLI